MGTKKEKPLSNGEIPNSVINQIIEHTVGGFVLFYFNSETGEPEQIMTFDSPAHSMAIQKFIDNWITAVNTVNQNNSISAIEDGLSQLRKEQEKAKKDPDVYKDGYEDDDDD